MPEDPTLPLQIANPDPALDLKDVLRSTRTLLSFVQRHLGVDGGKIKEAAAVVIATTEPGASDRNKLWLKNSSPCGVGVFCDGKYQVISQYPPNVAMLWVGSREPPSYLTKLTNSEKDAAGFDTDATFVAYKV